MASQLPVLEILERYGSIGPDFLTWLCACWMRGETPAPPSEPGLEIMLQGPVTLAGQAGEATKVTLSGDDAAGSPEVIAALRQGKRLVRSKLVFTAAENSWTFSLDAETFDLKSIKLPVPKIPDLNEYLSLRVQATQHLARILEELFELFLPLRLDAAAWKAEVETWAKD